MEAINLKSINFFPQLGSIVKVLFRVEGMT
jgi:hypothetical protein